MPLPPKATKITKNGVTLENNVDRITYTLEELSRAALRDTGKFVVKIAREKAPKKTGLGRKSIQMWNKKGKGGLRIGIKSKGFYMGFFELGSNKQPKIAMIQSTVEENIPQIREIQAQYLSAIEDENKALSLIDEDEFLGGEENQ